MFQEIKIRLVSFIRNKCSPRKQVGVHHESDHDEVPGPSVSKDIPEQANTQCHYKKEKHKKRPQFPMTPKDVFMKYWHRLTMFELREISKYTELWYLGKKIAGSAQTNATRSKVSYDHIAYRYEVLDTRGEGAYGKVFKCLDHKTNEMVAVKILKDMRTFREEVNILDYLRKKYRNGSYNIVYMKTYFYFRNHLCIVYELLGPTLSELKKRQVLKKDDVLHIAKKLVRCLRLLEKEKIIHGDLKPGNIMLTKKGHGIKVIDFGGSRFEHQTHLPNVRTHIYSPPEVLLKNHYTIAYDMWSLGCILVELHTGRYLFPGVDDSDQIALIIEVLGRPPREFVQERKTWNYFYDHNGQRREIYDSEHRKIKPGSKTLQRILNTNDHLFVDFIQRCLNWNPEDRLTPVEAMEHPWLQQNCHYCKARKRTRKKPLKRAR